MRDCRAGGSMAAGELREKVARAVFIAAVGEDGAPVWDAPGERGRARWYAYADALMPIIRLARAEAWLQGHVAGRDYQGDGWNADSHDPDEDNPYRKSDPS